LQEVETLRKNKTPRKPGRGVIDILDEELGFFDGSK
jgi:hypothetical protein